MKIPSGKIRIMYYRHIKLNPVKDHLGYVDKDMHVRNIIIVKINVGHQENINIVVHHVLM